MTSRGLYRCAQAGEPTNVTGVDALCEQPSQVDLRVETVAQTERTPPPRC